MKRICWAVVATLLLCGCRPVEQYETAHGEPAALTQYFGRPLLVSYYAPWCVPCQRELPLLQAMVMEHDLQVLLVSYDADNLATLLEQAATLPSELTLVRPLPGKALPYPAPSALPTSYLLNASGELQETITGEISPHKAEALTATMLTPLPRPEPWATFSSRQ